MLFRPFNELKVVEGKHLIFSGFAPGAQDTPEIDPHPGLTDIFFKAVVTDARVKHHALDPQYPD
jgi:hypothetical protein